MGLPPPNSLTGRIADTPGGGEIGLTNLQMNYITALSFKLMRPFRTSITIKGGISLALLVTLLII